MPQQTFFNLPETKQEHILYAALQEFARVPFAEASIANIIRDADISRGSFYQYFTNKEDLFHYLLSIHLKERHIGFITNLEKHNGDIFSAVLDAFKYTLAELNKEHMHGFYENIFLHLNYKTEKTIVNHMSKYDLHQRFAELKPYINAELLNCDDDKEIFHTIQIISVVMMQNFVLKFAKELSNEAAIENFEAQLYLLQKGLLKIDD